MATQTIHTALDLEVLDCVNCGTYFAMSQKLINAKRRDGGSFFCPNGHSMSYTETDRTRAEKQARALEAQLVAARDQAAAAAEETETVRRSRSALRGQLTRERKRTAAGTCPCCKRTFQQLSRHMDNQHPEYVDEHRAKA